MKVKGNKYFKIITGIILSVGLGNLIMLAYNGVKLVSHAKEYTISQNIYTMEIKDTTLSSLGSEFKYRIVSEGSYKYGEKIVILESEKNRHYLIELPIKNIESISFEKNKKPLSFSGLFFDPLHIRNSTSYFPIRNDVFKPSKNMKIGYDGEATKNNEVNTMTGVSYMVLKTDHEKIFEISFSNEREVDLIIKKNEKSIELIITPQE